MADLPFAGSVGHTIGIELETTVIDATTGMPLDCASEIVAAVGTECQRGGTSTELASACLEIKSGVGATVRQATDDLRAVTAACAPALGLHSARLLAMGLHPTIDETTGAMNASERYDWIRESLRWTCADLYTCALQVHVGVPDGDAAVRAARYLAPYLPILLAMTASSPMYRGEHTGLASTRSSIFTRVPRSGLPPQWASWAEYCDLVDAFTASGAMRGPLDAWWDIRLQPALGTVEVRVCDALADPDCIAGIAAIAQCLVALSASETAPQLADAIAHENRWTATRDGIRGRLITDDSGAARPASDLACELVHQLRDVALDLGCSAELEGAHAMAEGRAAHQDLMGTYAAGGMARMLASMTLARQ